MTQGTKLFALIVSLLAAAVANGQPSNPSKQDLPENGKLWAGCCEPVYQAPFLSPLLIAAKDNGKNYLVRIYNQQDRIVMSIFVRGEQSVQTYAPRGAFFVKFATGGEDWYGPNFLFGPNTIFYKYELATIFDPMVANKLMIETGPSDFIKQIDRKRF